jgi:hypothetical protein
MRMLNNARAYGYRYIGGRSYGPKTVVPRLKFGLSNADSERSYRRLSLGVIRIADAPFGRWRALGAWFRGCDPVAGWGSRLSP